MTDRTGSGAPPFVHLRTRSAYSLLEGALHLKDIVKLAVADGQPAVALTDRANLFGALEFSEKAAEAGLQPIVGCDLPVTLPQGVPGAAGPAAANGTAGQGAAIPVRPAERKVEAFPLLLLAATPQGYANLVRVVSHAYLDSAIEGETALAFADLAAHREGLIVLTGWREGPLGDAVAEGRPEWVAARLAALREVLGDRLYVEVQRHGRRDDHIYEAAMVDAAARLDVPVVATNDAHFARAEDFEAHDALLCIQAGARISDDGRRRLTPEHRFKTSAEMVETFRDLPAALEATVEIARRSAVRPRKVAPILPRFTEDAEAAEGADDAVAAEAALLSRMATDGLERRLAVKGLAPGTCAEDYRSRLAHELKIITNMKYPGYFLIVADFIQWAKRQGIPVGPGRGSGAGSLVAYALTITDLDPLAFGLLFERFLNPERVSMPDFDIDFCQERRDEVIRYVRERYGQDRVAQIITFGTLQARAVLRDVGRVLEMPYGQVDKLCKLVPANPANPVTLKDAIEGEPRLQEARDGDPVVGQLLSMSLKLEGLYRHASTHAAGIVIGDRPLEELVPLYRDPRSELPVTQFNMKWVESAGLVKFDFLGLKTLTVIDTALSLVRRKGVEVDLETLPLDDERTYRMLARGETVGVFQLESQGMRKALIGMRPDRFEDIVAIVALYRPGPMDNIPTYNRRKHGEETPDYLHPKLEPILKETFGVIIYQEQVMQIAQVLSGYSLGEADLLRRAMGKKIKAEMDVQRERFVKGAVEGGVERASAVRIFDLVAKFANYGFNKSHAAAYALIAYQTAWLKANHPVEFLAASMTLDMGNTDKLSDFRREAQRLGIAILKPSVTVSGAAFDAVDGAISYALGAIKGLGRPVVDHIAAIRAERPFAGLGDFAARINPKIVGRRALEQLISAGAFDAWEPNRARLMAGVDAIVGTAARLLEAREAGQSDFFGAMDEGPQEVPLPDAPPWPDAELLQREHAAIGFYLSAHPLDAYADVLKATRVSWWADFEQAVKAGATAGRLAGTVTQRTERRTRSGGRMGIVAMSDPTGQYEAVLFSDGLALYRDLLEPGEPVVLVVNAEEREEGVSVRIQSVEPLEVIAAKRKARLKVFLKDEAPLDGLARLLDAPGQAEVELVLLLDGGAREVEVRLPQRFHVTPPVAGAVKAMPGVIDVELI